MTHSFPTRRSSDRPGVGRGGRVPALPLHPDRHAGAAPAREARGRDLMRRWTVTLLAAFVALVTIAPLLRSEEHTSELQSLMRISYAVLCLKQKNKTTLHIDVTTNV